MDRRKFANLRLESLKNAAVPAVLGAAFLLEPEEAAAATVALPQHIHAGGALWNVTGSTSATSGSPAGLGIRYATGTAAGYVTSSPTAYNGAFILVANQTAFQAPGGQMDLTGTTLTSGPVTNFAGSGLTTSAQFYFAPSSPATVRVIYTFTNPTNHFITLNVQWQNNLGGEGAPVVATSSNTQVLGQLAETAADRWIITQFQGRPVIDTVRYGPGAADTPTPIQSVGSPNNSLNSLVVDQYSLVVPAGGTQLLMFFGRLSTTQAGAITNAAAFNTNNALISSGLLTGLTTLQESEIVNWSFPAPPAPTVPAISPLPFLLLATLVGALGARYLRWPVSDH